MSLEVLKCPNCGAPMPAGVVEAVVVCAYCSRSVANPAALRTAPQAAAPPVAPQAAPPAPPAQQPVAQQPVAQQPVAQQPVAQQPAKPVVAAKVPPSTEAPVMKPIEAPAMKPIAAPAAKPIAKSADPAAKGVVTKVAAAGAGVKVAIGTKGADAKGASKSAIGSIGKGRPLAVNTGRNDDEEEEDEDEEEFEWSEEGIVEFAMEALGQHDSLFFDPKIPPAKLKAATGIHKRSLARDERVLVLFDDTVFGGADDGFIVTTEQFAWKNIMEDPKHFAWDEIDPDEVEWTAEGLTVMGEAVQVSQADGSVMYPALGEFIYEMASMAADLEEDDE